MFETSMLKGESEQIWCPEGFLQYTIEESWCAEMRAPPTRLKATGTVTSGRYLVDPRFNQECS